MNSSARSSLSVVLVATIAGSFAFVLGAAEPKPQTVRPAETDRVLASLWRDVVSATPDNKPARMMREWKMILTTWLPDQWPPTSRTVWSRYAYGLDISMDGASDVSAPFARVERRAGSSSLETITPMADRLKVIAVHPVRPHKGWRYTLDDEKRMLQMALSLTTEPPADSRTGIGLRSYFQSWRLGSAEIAAHVEPRHRDFFKWLTSSP
jgi:hypothetical protein